jgi:hypothetical protein
MSRREDRERKMAGWLGQLQSWKASGEALSAYARSQGVEPWSMYYWRKVLQRKGQWPQEPGGPDREQSAAVAPDSTRAPVRFARVRLQEASRSSVVTVRVTLLNGRRVEIELEDTQRLSEVFSAIESAA